MTRTLSISDKLKLRERGAVLVTRQLDSLLWAATVPFLVLHLINQFFGSSRVERVKATFAACSLDDDDLDQLVRGGPEFDRVLGIESLVVQGEMRRAAVAEYWRRWAMCGLEVRDVERELAQVVAGAIVELFS